MISRPSFDQTAESLPDFAVFCLFFSNPKTVRGLTAVYDA